MSVIVSIIITNLLYIPITLKYPNFGICQVTHSSLQSSSNGIELRLQNLHLRTSLVRTVTYRLIRAKRVYSSTSSSTILVYYDISLASSFVELTANFSFIETLSLNRIMAYFQETKETCSNIILELQPSGRLAKGIDFEPTLSIEH